MINDLNEIKKQLNNIGCGMCLAKWTQVTMHLHNGMTHSCHHPSPHKIPLEEIKRNPTALHNTSFKKEKRREICSPMFSSKWMEEIERYGAYPTSTNFNDLTWTRETNQLPYKHSEENPYVESFWNWWPELYNDLHTFRITGGEPLLSKDTWKILDFIETTDKPNRKLNLSINTNLGSPKQLIEKFVLKVKNIINQGNVNEFIIFTSVESWEEQAEYIRNGLDFGLFFENVEYILKELPKVTINVMATFNALSIFGYGKLIDKIFSLKEKYRNNERYWISAIQLDTSYLRWPQHLSVKILEDEQKEFILEYAKKAFYYATPEFNHNHFGFSDVEVQKIKRLYDYAISKDDFDIDKHRNDFVLFVDEHDKRRGTNFLETFPEFKNLYKNVKNRKG